MKLRLAGNSVRLRLLQSEVERLRVAGHLEEVLVLGVDADGAAATFAYALQCGPAGEATGVRYAEGAITVVVAEDRVRQWATSNEVGLYDTLPVGADRLLDVTVEKDFACLDLSDADNVDTFPNPLAGTAC